MSALVVQDLDHNVDLDQKAMKDILGGWTYTGSSYSYTSYSFLSKTITDSGFKWIGGVKYKVRKMTKKYKRTQYRYKKYTELTLVF